MADTRQEQRSATKLGPSFHRLITASALANLADGIFQVALPLLAVTLTRSPGAGRRCRPRPAAPVAGDGPATPARLADRLDRKRTMVHVGVLHVTVMGALALAVGFDVASMPMLYVSGLVLGIGETLFDTAAQSILPHRAARAAQHRQRAPSGRGADDEHVHRPDVRWPPGRGPRLASAFAVSAGAYLAGALCFLGIAGSFWPERVGPPATMRHDIAEGVRFVWSNPVLRTLALMLGVTNLAFMAHFSVFVLFATGPMGMSRAGYGLLLASSALGGIAGARAGPVLERTFGTPPAACSARSSSSARRSPCRRSPPASRSTSPLIAASFGSVVWNVITVSLRQRITPDRLMGRMNSAYRLLGWGTMPIGAALGGAIAEVVGLRATFIITSLMHVPLLIGFLVVTEGRIQQADTVSTS